MAYLSIIVVMYNAESYLTRCLDSILCTDNQEIEVILIDDGSTDSSLDICQKYSACDSRVEVYTKTNGGVASARNYGLKMATGEYIWFIDSDDWIKKDSIDVIISNLKKNDADFYQINFEHSTGYDKSSCTIRGIEELRLVEKQLVWKLYFLQDINAYAWGHVVKKKLYEIDNIVFPEGRIFEDTAITHRLLNNAQKVYVDSTMHYCYYTNLNSATHQWTTKKIDDLLSAYEQIERDLKAKISLNEEMTKMSQMYLCNGYVQMLFFLYSVHDECGKNMIRKYSERIKKNIKRIDEKVKVTEYYIYCKKCRVSMFKHYVLYKIGMLRLCIGIRKVLK